jgi:adenylate kinase family enzyme
VEPTAGARVVVLGRGGAGKSTFARGLGERTGLPVIELDAMFWQAGLVARTAAEWTGIQQELLAAPRWIMDGDLGPYDVADVRLRAADTVLVLDFSLLRCAWRALRRSRERLDFWLWLIGYRRVSLPPLRAAIARSAPDAAVHVLRNPRAVARFLASLPET